MHNIFLRATVLWPEVIGVHWATHCADTTGCDTLVLSPRRATPPLFVNEGVVRLCALPLRRHDGTVCI
jgi:hypothetical protein